jgi:hypothetical protein
MGPAMFAEGRGGREKERGWLREGEGGEKKGVGVAGVPGKRKTSNSAEGKMGNNAPPIASTVVIAYNGERNCKIWTFTVGRKSSRDLRVRVQVANCRKETTGDDGSKIRIAANRR